jgi:hypothetical protein
LRASQERRRLAALIANTQRHHPDSPELPAMRARLNQLRIRDIASWCSATVIRLPDTGEIADATVEVREVARRMAGRMEMPRSGGRPPRRAPCRNINHLQDNSRGHP